MAHLGLRRLVESSLVFSFLLARQAHAVTNIASWQGLRGSQIQSKIVLEGGRITNGTFNNGQWSDTASAQHSYGIYYQIDLTKSFDASIDSTDAYMIPGLPETSNTDAPNYLGGGMFHNDYQFYTFGGLADKPPIDASTVLRGDVFASNPSVSRFDQGVAPNQQTDGVSDNITSGAYASSPDQGLGFYFSGMVSATRAQLEYNSGDTEDNHPTVTSDTFIKVDMTTANDANFQYMAWPAGLTPRAEGALVWLPYGNQGVLIAIGGVEVPGDLFLFPPRETNDGPFMTELAIYDIDADTWQVQQTRETTEKPTQLASFCTAVVPSQDGSAHQIFVYGGYDGTYTSVDPNVRGDVWVLSVPAFQWTKVETTGRDNTHARQGSVCFSPNPTTMITVGGSGQLGASLTSDTIIDVLDLNTLAWTGKYNASSDANFSLPDAIVQQLSYPSASGPGENSGFVGLNGTLDQLFSTRYSGEVKTYYPYASANNTGGNNPSTVTPVKSKSKWKVPVIATLCTVGGLAIIAALLFFCLRRHRKNKQGVNKTQQSRKNVFSWLGKSSQIDPEPEKSHTTDDTVVESNPDHLNQKAVDGEVYEAPSQMTSSGWNYGVTAQNQGAPAELMSHVPRESTSISKHPYYPRSLSGDHIVSGHSGSVSRFSEGLPQGTAAKSPYELSHGKSNEKLSEPKRHNELEGSQPDDNHGGSHDERETGLSPATASNQGQTSMGGMSPSPITPRDQRPGHHRNASSMSSDMPSLPSPPPEEDARRSQYIDAMPNMLSSPIFTTGSANQGEEGQQGLKTVQEEKHT
ncbi:hypothetical protein OHC33_005906 [Knufia fluminis]|uniref:Uncharacterized protein n=1 Tax=Knufia fluminis TaxID=191047 RepID=A0AAN8EVV3_9EURO|nr:hypothetical protein OHC33_005906 [Knufia fluminis]